MKSVAQNLNIGPLRPSLAKFGQVFVPFLSLGRDVATQGSRVGLGHSNSLEFKYIHTKRNNGLLHFSSKSQEDSPLHAYLSKYFDL